LAGTQESYSSALVSQVDFQQPARAANVPIEPGAAIDNDLRGNAKLLNELVKFVRENDYRCDSISAVRPFLGSRGFSLVCNRFGDRFEIEDKGGHWIVNAK
jgi:hypothetical protein